MSLIFRATRYIGRYLKILGGSQGFRYLGYRHAAQQEQLLVSNPNPVTAPGLSDIPPKLRVFQLPKDFKPTVVQLPDYIDKLLAPLVQIIDQDPTASLYLSMDAEWNISRRMGVSTIQLCPHFDPLAVYIIRVHRLSSLPPSLLRLLTSERVWKIGSRIKGDLTRLKKQFPSQLDDNTRFSTIDLKDLARSRGLIQPRQSGSLAALCDAILGLELPKDPKIRANNNWEFSTISPALLYYAACDVAASRHIFEAMFDHTLSITEQTLPTSLDDGSEGAQVDVQVIEAEADVEVFYVKESRYL